MRPLKNSILYLGTRALSLEKVAEIEAARRLGYDVVMASDNPDVFSSYGFEHNFEAPLSKHDEATNIILEYFDKHSLSVSGVVSWQDQEEELAARLAAHLNLAECTLDSNRKARDKTATREMLSKINEKYNPKYQLVNSEISFEESIEKIGLPCILKLAGNSGGRGVLAITSESEVKEKWDKFIEDNATSKGGLYTKYRDSILLEELVTGSEHSISGMVTDKDIYLLAITDKRIDHTTQLQYENVLPSCLSLRVQEEIKVMAEQMITASGIQWRGFHIDFIVTKTGIKVLEMGARLGGECINSHLVPMASSNRINPYELLIEYIIQGRKPPLSRSDYTQDFDRRAGSRVVAPTSPGWITDIRGLDKLCEHPNTRDFVQLKGIGSKMRPPTDAYEEYKVAYVIAECPLTQNLSQILDEMTADIKISTTSSKP